MEGMLIVFRSNMGGEGTLGQEAETDLVSIYTIPPPSSSSKCVLQKVEEMQSYLGIFCVGYEDNFKALLTEIKAGHHLQDMGSKEIEN